MTMWQVTSRNVDGSIIFLFKIICYTPPYVNITKRVWVLIYNKEEIHL